MYFFTAKTTTRVSDWFMDGLELHSVAFRETHEQQHMRGSIDLF